MRTNLKDIEEKIKPLGNKLSYDKEFIFDLLASYGRSASNISRLRNGQLNIADDKNTEIAQKNVVYFKPAEKDIYAVIDDLKSSSSVVRYSTRFVIVTDYQHLLAVDTKTNETLDIAIRDIDKHYAFFLPWAGMEKAQFVAENHADVKAAEKMAKLFDILVAHNGYTSPLEWHNLTTFFTRLLFCFFAEDTSIFKKNQFSHAIVSFTQEDGSDLKQFLKVLFASLDDEDKEGYPAHLAAFPYVNGQLFRDFTQIPDFNKEARNLLIESASKLDWSDINPDIFGSMFQAVVRPGERTSLGQHYTSVPNIMKTIEPLFLDELKSEFDKSYDDVAKLEKLLNRISAIKVFDPACGSGNFLVIAYKELRRLEHAILERQGELRPHQIIMLGSRINIENFYGIEIDDFAHEVAILSLWLAKHQMNLVFTEKFGIDLLLIPLKESGNIVQGNACQLDWNKVCRNNGTDEIYLISNPPYQGGKKKSPQQSRDFAKVFADRKYSKNLDYISLWFIKGARYVTNSRAELAFVSTNSLCQGDHVGHLWPFIYELSVEIGFAVTSFKWENNAKGKAGVSCIIVSLRALPSDKAKYIFSDGIKMVVSRINAYLADGNDTIVHSRTKAISDVPDMVYGNMPLDGGFLKLDDHERNEILNANPDSSKFIRRLIGGDSLLRGTYRYCLWIDDEFYNEAIRNPIIRKRIEGVRNFRDSGGEVARTLSNRPHQFRYRKTSHKSSIAVPCTSTEKREYMPIDIFPAECILDHSVQALYDAPLYIAGLITSRLHMVWTKAVAGQLETRIRYSALIVYNTFPVPLMTESDKKNIEDKVMAILDCRENYPDKNIAELYDPDKMPDDLRMAHGELDDMVDKAYRKKSFKSDEERLSLLIEMYEHMIEREKETV